MHVPSAGAGWGGEAEPRLPVSSVIHGEARSRREGPTRSIESKKSSVMLFNPKRAKALTCRLTRATHGRGHWAQRTDPTRSPRPPPPRTHPTLPGVRARGHHTPPGSRGALIPSRGSHGGATSPRAPANKVARESSGCSFPVAGTVAPKPRGPTDQADLTPRPRGPGGGSCRLPPSDGDAVQSRSADTHLISVAGRRYHGDRRHSNLHTCRHVAQVGLMSSG